MKRFIAIFLGILCVLLFNLVSFAKHIEIENYQELLKYSAKKDSVTLKLSKGDYLITSKIAMLETDYKNLIIDNVWTNLIVDNTDKEEILFTLNSLTLGVHGGTIIANGGMASNNSSANGIYAINFIQNGGSITATGGKAAYTNASADGIYAVNFTQNGGSMTATGGSYGYAYGIDIKNSLVQNGGSIIANGGIVADSHGIRVSSLIQNEGNIIATGAIEKNSANGIDVTENLVQNGGTIEATGGDNSSGQGIYAVSFVQNGGSIKASGGKGSNSWGINTTNLTQNGGIIEAYGGTVGSNSNKRGFRANIFVQNGGSVKAFGGNAMSSYGFSAITLTQNNGMIAATGGTSSQTYGLYAETIIQSGGNIEATGGSNTNAYGLYVHSSMNISSELTIKPEGKAAAVHVNGTSISSGSASLIFTSTETSIPKLNVEIDLNTKTSNKINILQQNVDIDEKTILYPVIKNTSRFDIEAEKYSSTFIETQKGSIKGVFDYSKLETITFKAEAIIDSSNASKQKYILELKREITPAEALKEHVDQRTHKFLEQFYGILIDAELEEYKKANLVLDKIDNFREINDAVRYVDRLKLESTSQSIFWWKDLTQAILSNKSISFNLKLAKSYPWLEFSGGVSRYSDDSNVKGEHFEAAIGSASTFTYASLVGLVTYNYDQIEGEYLTTTGNSIGVFVAAGYKLFDNAMMKTSTGYIYRLVNTNRIDTLDELQDSSTHHHAYSLGMELSFDLVSSSKLSVIPSIGLNYIYMKFNGYQESNLEGFNMSVKTTDFAALEVKTGVCMEVAVTSMLKLQGHIFGSYDLRGDKLKLEVTQADLADFDMPEYQSKSSRLSLDIGAGLAFRTGNGTDLITEYTLHKNNTYFNHQIKFQAGWIF